MVLVVNPARPHCHIISPSHLISSFVLLTGELICEILEVLIAVLVYAHHCSGFGIACALSTLPAPSGWSPICIPICYKPGGLVSVVSVSGSGRVSGSVPAFGGRIPVVHCQWASDFQWKLWGVLALKPILRKLRSVLISVDMAALSARSRDARTSLLD